MSTLQKKQSMSKWRFLAIFFGAGFIALACVAMFVQAASRPHFRMSVTVDHDSTEVQFVQPRARGEDYRLISPKFVVSAEVRHAIEFDMKDAASNFAEAVIEFSDMTIPPGRIRLRFGGRTFDVMSSRMIVDGQDVAWLSGNDHEQILRVITEEKK